MRENYDFCIEDEWNTERALETLRTQRAIVSKRFNDEIHPIATLNYPTIQFVFETTLIDDSCCPCKLGDETCEGSLRFKISICIKGTPSEAYQQYAEEDGLVWGYDSVKDNLEGECIDIRFTDWNSLEKDMVNFAEYYVAKYNLSFDKANY